MGKISTGKKMPAATGAAEGPKKVIRKARRPDAEERIGRFSVALARKKFEYVTRKGNEHRRVFSKTALEDITALSVAYAEFAAGVAHKALCDDRNRMFLPTHLFKAIIALPIEGATMNRVLDRAVLYMKQSRDKSSDNFHGRHGTKTMTHAHTILHQVVLGNKPARSKDDDKTKGGAAKKNPIRVSIEAALVLAALMDVAVEIIVETAVAPAPEEDLSQSKLVRAVGEVRNRTGLFHNLTMEIEADIRPIPPRVLSADENNMRALRSKKAKMARGALATAAPAPAPTKKIVKKVVKKVVKKPVEAK